MDMDVEDDGILFDDFSYLQPEKDIADELHEYLHEEIDYFNKNLGKKRILCWYYGCPAPLFKA